MKANRLLSALLLLQAHGKLTSRGLAGRLEVSERTAHRDMEALSAAGVPVFATRGVRGGWQLEDGWRTRVPGLDDAELSALLMTQARAIAEPRLAVFAERAITKLTASLPAPLRERAASMRKRLHVDTTGWHGREENLAALPVVQDAVSSERMLAFRYCPPGREAAERCVGPLGLVAKGTTWYLVASAATGLRTYRVSRIEDARVLDETFARPLSFDLAAYWKSTTDRLTITPRCSALLRATPESAESLKTWCRVERVESAAGDPDGWVTIRVDFNDEAGACFVVLGLGSRAEVIGPAELRTRVAAEVTTMHNRLAVAPRRRKPMPSRAGRRRV